MKMTDACCARTRCDAVLVSGSQHLCSITSSVSRHSVLVYFCRWWHTGNSNLYLNNNIQNFFFNDFVFFLGDTFDVDKLG